MPENRLEEFLLVTEGHGMIVGALAAGEEARAAVELAAATEGGNASERGLAFAAECRDGLRDGRVELPTMLLDETLSLATRAELLSAFTRGFLSGLGQAGERLATVGADGAEMLSDLEALSRGAALQGEAATHAEERAYRELLEYLRFTAAYFYRVLA